MLLFLIDIVTFGAVLVLVAVNVIVVIFAPIVVVDIVVVSTFWCG